MPERLEGTFCFYNEKNLDEICAAAILKSFLPFAVLETAPPRLQNPEDAIFVFDLRNKEELLVLAKAQRLSLISHKKRVVELVEETGFKATNRMVLNLHRSTAELVWDFFSPQIPPRAIWLIGAWEKGIRSHTVQNFHYGLKTISVAKLIPDNQTFWQGLFYQPKTLTRLCAVGLIVQDYEANKNNIEE